jgi:hypothetical protein
MINLELGENEVVVTLTENVVYPDNNVFLFVFYSNETRQSINFLAIDTSTAAQKERSNTFTIDVVPLAQQDLEDAKIYLPNKGFYEYTIYNQETQSLSIQPTDVIVEYGRVYYEYDEPSITSFSPDIEIITFNG